MAAAQRLVSSSGDEPTAVDESSAVNGEPCARVVNLPLASLLAMQPATPGRAVQQADTPPSFCSKRARDDAEEGSGAPPPKRPRYRVKTTPSPEESCRRLQVSLPEGFKEDIVSKRVWHVLSCCMLFVVSCCMLLCVSVLVPVAVTCRQMLRIWEQFAP